MTAVLPATGDRPELLAGSSSRRPDTPVATTWTFGADGWVPTPLPDGAGLTVTDAMDDGTRTWLTGWRWRPDEGVSPALFSSADRTSWQEQDVVGSTGAMYPSSVVPTSDGPLLLGRTVDEEPVAWRPDAPAETPLPLPEGHEGRVTHAAALTPGGRTVVAVVAAGEPGAPQLPSSVVSDDAGLTWRAGTPLAGARATVAGLAVTDGRIVATGWVREDGRSVPAAWSSPDGVTWSALEPMADLGMTLDEYPSIHVWLGAPTVADGRVLTSVVASPLLSAQLVELTDQGWDLVEETVPDWRGPGIDPTVVAGDGGLLVTQSFRGGTRVRRQLDDRWQEWQLGEVADVPVVDALVPSSAGADLWTLRADVSVRPSGYWLQEAESSAWRIGPDSQAEPLQWPGTEADPEVSDLAERLTGVVVTPGQDGSTLVLGEVLTETDTGTDADTEGWLEDADGSRRLVTGLDGPQTARVSGAVQVAGTWYAVGGTEADISDSSTSTAQVWRAVDGVTWVPVDGEYRHDDERESSAAAVCEGPGSQVLVVGTAQSDGEDRGVVWSLTKEGAATRVWTGEADVDTSLTGCAVLSGADVTLLTGRAGGRATRWTTTDGVTFDAAPLGGLGTTYGPLRAVEGGFAAAGQTTRGDDAWIGAVVHLSSDGTTWRTLRVPTTRYTEGADVAVLGDDLLVAGDTAGGPELWVLRDHADQL